VSESPALIYLEADDEITAVVRRIREADADRVVIVAPGRSRATSSVIALRLLAREDREVAIVGDALTRSLAAEALVAAYATIDEARRADAGALATASERRHAAIHVVRGPSTDDTAPTLAVTGVADDARQAETRQVLLAGSRSMPRMARRQRVHRSVPVAFLVAAGAVLLAVGIAGVIVLPAATITISPRSEAVDPRTYVIEFDDPESLSGMAESVQTVTASGTYAEREPATGSVLLFNWDNVAVDVPAGTLVAAGNQAFATLEAVTAPAGELTAEGTIQAGEVAVGIVASQAGPAANVAAAAIDTVLNQGTASQLRGFQNNQARLVTNPDATSGGIDETGPEFTQEDLDTAVTALRDDLDRQVAEALDPEVGTLFVPGEPAEAVIEGIGDVVGTRDQPTSEISGTLGWEGHAVEVARIEDEARASLADDADALREGHELLIDATEIEIGEATLVGGRMTVEVEVRGRSTTTPERGMILELAAGRPADEARQALDDLGDATVELWPGWVGSVPDLEWRIDVRITSAP